MATRKKAKTKAKRKKAKKTKTKAKKSKTKVKKKKAKKTAAKAKPKKTKTKTKKSKTKTKKTKARPKRMKAKTSKPKAKPKATAIRPPTPAPQPTVPTALPGEERIGVVTHYFTHLSVAIIKLETDSLREGDIVHIKGHTSDFSQPVESMEIDYVHVTEARPGQSIGLRVKEHAREHDVVYKVKR